MTDELSPMTNIKAEMKTPKILELDPALGPYKDHFEYRMKRFSEQKLLIDQYEGSVEEFAKGNNNTKGR